MMSLACNLDVSIHTGSRHCHRSAALDRSGRGTRIPFLFQGVDMRLRNVLVVLFALALAYGRPMPAAAQSATTGRIVGTVNDPQGAAVPGATVTASSPQL